jgi:Adenylate cyclase regulatory domain
MSAAYTREDAAHRAGIAPEDLDRLVALGIVTREDRFTDGDVRKAQLARSLEVAGIPLDAVGSALMRGALSVDFLDTPAYERLGATSLETFREAHERTGIPMDLLVTVREALGLAVPEPDDRLREDEEAILPFLQIQLESGFRQTSIERLLRVSGDALRRIAEQEAAWWQAEVIGPAIAAGKRRKRSPTRSSQRGSCRWPIRRCSRCAERTRRADGHPTSSSRSSRCWRRSGSTLPSNDCPRSASSTSQGTPG